MNDIDEVTLYVIGCCTVEAVSRLRQVDCTNIQVLSPGPKVQNTGDNKVEDIGYINTVSASDNHVVFLSNQGKVFACGSNTYVSAMF